MRNRSAESRPPASSWTADDLRRALLRRANFRIAGRRCRRTGAGLAHAGVSRRAVRVLGRRAALALIRRADRGFAARLLNVLVSGKYHDEHLLAYEILDRLADVWSEWAFEAATSLARDLRHPWAADRLARVEGRLISRNPSLLTRHANWAVGQNPLKRRAAAMALLPHPRPRRSKGVPVSRAQPILRLLLLDPEPHPWVQYALGCALVHYAARAPRTIARLLAGRTTCVHERHLNRTRLLLDSISSVS